MPRSVSGNYTLPLPPVVPNTTIEADWANTTDDDIAQALTDSLDRYGRGGMVAPFRLVDGSESVPAWAFASETGTGMYREDDGLLSVSIQGTKVGQWSADGYSGVVAQGYFADGTAALPSIAFNSDHATGMWLPGVGALGFSTAGAERMRIDAAGRVKIGPAADTTSLIVSGGSSAVVHSDLTIERTGPPSFLLGRAPAIGFSQSGTPQQAVMQSSEGNFQWFNLEGSTWSERMRLNPVGGLSLMGPGGFLSVKGELGAIIQSDTARGALTDYFHFYAVHSNATAVAFRVLGNGSVQNATNSYGSTSDARLKHSIEDATPKLADLLRVRVRKFRTVTEPNLVQIGVVAQELQEVFPGMVEESPHIDGKPALGIKYSVFVPMLIKALQELNAKVDAL